MRIKPALANGKFVILDRYYFSTLAYQGARGLSIDELWQQHQGFILEPDIVFIFHLNIDAASERIKNRSGLDVMEEPEYQREVDTIFRTFNAPNIHHIEADLTIEEIHKQITKKIAQIL